MLDFLAVLSRRWRIVFAFAVLGVAVSAGVTTQQTPSYRADAQIFVALSGEGTTGVELNQGAIFSAQRVKSYTSLVDSPLVLDPVIKKLGLDTTATALAGKLAAEVPTGTVLIEVTADDESPQRAADLANEVSSNLITVVEDLDRTETSEASPVRMSIVRPGVPPLSARTPVPALNIAVGLFLGLGIGLAAAAVRDALDTTIKDESDVEATSQLPTLGSIPTNTSITSAPLIEQGASTAIWSESYRKLRTSLSYLDPDDPPRCLLVTSPSPGEGKSVTAANLAASLAQSGRSTILVEADLRRPSLGKLLGLVPDVGVTNVVTGRASVDEVRQDTGGFSVLTSGPLPPNPSELLGSHAFGSFVRDLLDRYDNVVIDTPPLLAVTDAAVAAVTADAVLVVCRSRQTRRPELRRALDALRAVDARIAGVVLNQVPPSSGAYYRYEYRPKSRRSLR